MKCEADAKEIMYQIENMRLDHERKIKEIDRRHKVDLILIFLLGILPYFVMAAIAYIGG
jgi:hypothetical protein